MSLSYHFKFSAPATKAAAELEVFFRTLEQDARRLGFAPTIVINAKFDTDERRQFARRLTTGLKLDDDALKGVILLDEKQIFTHDPVHGHCRVIPTEGVFMVVTNEKREEAVFGLLRFHKQQENGLHVICLCTASLIFS